MLALGYFRNIEQGISAEDLEANFAEYCYLYLHQPTRIFFEKERFPPYRAYTKMINHMVESTSSFLVVVPGPYDLGKTAEEVAKSVLELERIGAKVVCNDEDLPDPLQNALSILRAEKSSLARSNHIKESMRQRAIKGVNQGRTPFGYTNGPEGILKINVAESEIVKLIYKLYTVDSLGLRLITRHLNEGGHKTRKANLWNIVTIRDILRNSVYMGTYTRFGLRVPKSHEAIISAETFRSAQDIFRERKKHTRTHSAKPFLLSNLIYCSECENKMMGVTRRQTWKRKDLVRQSRIYRYYQCQSRNNLSICRYHTWKAEILDSLVLKSVKKLLASRKGQRSLTQSTERDSRFSDIGAKRLENAERKFLNMLKTVASGDVPTADLAPYLEELDDSRKLVINPPNVRKKVLDNVDEWNSLDIVSQQEFLKLHIEKVIVHEKTVDLIS
ncbi:MAG: recombinase family protein [Chloroflexota bacterium]|nr:recombinase family protein [Chloroflexota bacterium]